MIIETNTPWICGFKQCRNERVDDFPFIYRCQHCGAEPKAYQCHHCGELIFFTTDQQKINYAKCVNIPVKTTPAEKDRTAEKITKQHEEKRDLMHELEVTQLKGDLKEAKKRVEDPKEKTERQILEESIARFVDRNMSGAAIVQRLKAENADKYKDNPEELERQNLLVDQWEKNNFDKF